MQGENGHWVEFLVGVVGGLVFGIHIQNPCYMHLSGNLPHHPQKKHSTPRRLTGTQPISTK